MLFEMNGPKISGKSMTLSLEVQKSTEDIPRDVSPKEVKWKAVPVPA